jgi:hypothetical protein
MKKVHTTYTALFITHSLKTLQADVMSTDSLHNATAAVRYIKKTYRAFVTSFGVELKAQRGVFTHQHSTFSFRHPPAAVG